MGKFIPLSIPNFEGNERKYVDDAIEQGWVSTGGAYITKLEEELSKFLCVEGVAACQSGTSGLHLSLIEAGVVPGDLVIVPTLTFIAAVNPVRYQFAEPVFMDCDNSLCIDPKKVRTFCEEECKSEADDAGNYRLIHQKSRKIVRAIVVVHVFGNLVDMEQIMEIAQEFNLKVIEDATEALGSRFESGKYKGMYAGTVGDFGAYSFNGNKIITTGGGGAVTAKSKKIVDHMRYLSTQAKDDHQYYIHDEIGYNYRMTNVQAAIGCAQLEELSEFISRKRKNYERYSSCFEKYETAKLISFREDTFSNMWFYSLEIDMSKIGISLKEIISELEKRGVQTRAIWGLIHEQKPYVSALAYRIECAKNYSSCVINLPCSTQITDEDIKYVSEQIKSVLEEHRNV